MDNSTENSFNGVIPLTNVTSETVDKSEYIDFSFYDKVCFKDNDGLSPSKPGRCLCISHQTGGLMCYHVLTQTGKVISGSMLQRVTNIELSTDEVKETFGNFDAEIHQRLKADNRGYKGSKPNQQDLADILEEDPDFAEDF